VETKMAVPVLHEGRHNRRFRSFLGNSGVGPAGTNQETSLITREAMEDTTAAIIDAKFKDNSRRRGIAVWTNTDLCQF